MLNTEKMMLKKYYGFDEAFNILSKIDNKRNKLNEFKQMPDKNIDNKNATLKYLKIIKNKLIDTFSTANTAENR